MLSEKEQRPSKKKKALIIKGRTSNLFSNLPISSNHSQFNKDQNLISLANPQYAGALIARESRQIELLKRQQNTTMLKQILTERKAG